MNKLDKLEISLLNDYYGSLLTVYQADLIRLYYDDDLSLSEIADIKNITRQAALDVINRGTLKLKEFESKLHLAVKSQSIRKEIQVLMASCDIETSKKLENILRIVDEL
ncbi:MAG: putative DNA-binding protein [Firmicutes bacterium ADurb.Bin080]|jgi:uncharacterized protein|nr:DNA-binding protein [Clostridiales bacterium]OQC12681.1 MAG: putative DNA-binding protein [Firmicutes bacterium ADurb.Bin080]